ncbi:sulfotransferase family 2 domain-containing protein [Aliiglaciecola aliphaticivorans]
MRKVILHYHLFKNAGTSLDAAFKAQLSKDEWATREFPGHKETNTKQLTSWIKNNPQVKCFSSHSAFLPTPDIENITVYPVIFLRHPIDRIVSAYSFENEQKSDTFGAVLARNTTLAGYIETRLSMPHDRQCRNFQSSRFAMMYPLSQGGELARAISAIENLPYFGMVEKFSDSVIKLTNWLNKEGFHNLNLKPTTQNVSQNASLSIDEKLSKLQNTIGQDLFNHLLEVNADDLALYNRACQLWESVK